MTATELRNLVRNSDKRPVIVFSDGKVFKICDPDLARVTGPWEGTGQSLMIFYDDKAGFDTIDLNRISRVDVANA